MKKRLKNIYLGIWKCLHYVYSVMVGMLFLFMNSPKFIFANSYYPEFRQKSRLSIFIEQCVFVLRFGSVNEQYFVYGFDVKSRKEQEQYLHYPEFTEIRDNLNQKPFNQSKYNYIGILRDKFVFSQYLKALQIPTPEIIALVINGDLRYSKFDCNNLGDLINHDLDAFCKSIDGECADDIFKLIISERTIFINNEIISFDDFRSKINNGIYLVQERVNQHELVSKINPKSVNTIRLTTIFNPTTNTSEFFSATLRVGTGESIVDNWAVGGLLINIKDDGTLDKYGFFKPGFGGKVTSHPNSKIVFEGYSLPYFKEAVQYSLKLHNLLYGIHSIGWDIAITEDGPVFIEGNDNWELSVTQSSLRGMRKEFKVS